MKVMTKNKSKVRLSLDVSKEMYELICDLSKRTGSSNSDILRKAITLIKIALDAKNKGNGIAIVNEKREIVSELIGF